jgi:hypothetical protein
MRAAAIGLVLALALVARAPASEIPGDIGPRADLIRLEGRLGPPAPGRSAAADLELETPAGRMRLQVESARVLRGERSGPDFLDEVSAYRPSLLVQGPAEVLAKLTKATPGSRLVITGYHRSGSRTFALSSVEVEAAIS